MKKTTEFEKVNMKSLVDCLESLRKQGYTENFMITPEEVMTADSKTTYPPTDVKVQSFYRFEGESDPSDNSILYAVETSDGKKGVLTDAYGPYADSHVSGFMHQVEDIQKKTERRGPGFFDRLRRAFFLTLPVLVIAVILPGCVAKKKYRALNDQYTTLSTDYKNLDTRYNELYKAKAHGEQLSESELQKLNNELKQKLADLETSNKRVLDLQATMQRQRKAQQELLGKITSALVGFGPNDLTVEIRKDGKVYVSLSEKLLFKSGSYEVDPKGKQALGKLGAVLAVESDIEIEVEGHTDTVPFKRAQLKDNLDLSVMRATSIVRILEKEYGVDPKKMSASGRGESFPIADNTTPEGRAVNRRTEIILSPKISEIYKILEGS